MSEPTNRILAACDFSTEGRLAVRWGADLARRYGGRLTVIHVIHHPEPELPHIAINRKIGDLIEILRAEARARLDALLQEEGIDLPQTAVHLPFGKPAELIVKAAGDLHADLIVVGSRGKRLKRAGYLGSIAQKVIRKTGAAVLVARGSDLPDFQRVLIPVDFSSCSEFAASIGLEFVRPFNPWIRFLHAFATMGDLADKTDLPAQSIKAIDKEIRDQSQRALNELLDRLDLSGMEYTTRAVKGIAAHRIIREARNWEADLLVMGTHGRGGVEKLILGNTIEKIFRKVPCPLLAVRPPAAGGSEGLRDLLRRRLQRKSGQLQDCS